MSTPPRQRCPTTSEIRRVKIGCLYYEYDGADPWKRDRQRTRSGMTMACLIEMAYLSGQDISVMIRLRDRRDPMEPGEPHVMADGIFFRRDKTGNAVVIEWTPRLRAVVARLIKIRAEWRLQRCAKDRVETSHLFRNQDGKPMTYSAASNAWQDGLKRSGVKRFMFRDIRARALTDKEELEGIREANSMGTHTTEHPTADYVRNKKARKTKATR